MRPEKTPYSKLKRRSKVKIPLALDQPEENLQTNQKRTYRTQWKTNVV
jgi:hypothetical protein